MIHPVRRVSGSCLFVIAIASLTCAASAQMRPADGSSPGAKMRPAGSDTAAPAAVPGIIPSGFGDAVDRDVARLRAATERFRNVETAIAEGYPRTSECVEHQPHGAMGFHHNNNALMDATLDVEKPEVLVYEKMPDGTFKLNGVEYLVPIPAWTHEEPPTIMGQKLKRADKLGIWYLHVWNWKPSPTGIFADWNPDVKC